MNLEVRNKIEEVKCLLLKNTSQFSEIVAKQTKQKQELFKNNLLNVIEDSQIAQSKPPSQLPTNFLNKLTTYRNCGGNLVINENLQKILSLSTKCKKMFNDNFTLVNQQKDIEDKFLQDYKNQAHVIPKFTVMAREEINQLTIYYQKYEEALKVDEACNNIYYNQQSYFQQLARSNEYLFQEYFSNTNQQWIMQNSQLITQMRPKIQKINQLVEEHSTKEKQLTSYFSNFDFWSQVLKILQSKKSSAEIAKELFQGTPLVIEFLNSLMEAKTLLSELEQQSKCIIQNQQSQIQPFNSRENLTLILEQFLQVQENLKNGIFFYKDLQQKLEQIYIQLKDIIVTCEITQKEFVQQLIVQAHQFQQQKLRNSVLVQDQYKTPDASPCNASLSESFAKQVIQELPQEMQFFDPSSNHFISTQSVFVPDSNYGDDLMESVVVTTFADLANNKIN
eukprot:TRINITY_DN8825_c0_g1_i5.p1 TRINITY_DN8825_c0_g1~~TRINITY_DN8825_c0_g1_i5.p1  ORF type:complete len:449 (-),score=39.98 TRINITY_DN8825_c0_g1_i5:74-1420(-)